MQRIKVKSIKNTCNMCPSQWEGFTDSNRPVYVRYRWGYLSVRIGEIEGTIDDAVEGKEIFGKQIGHQYHGNLIYEQLKQEVDFIDWPENENS